MRQVGEAELVWNVSYRLGRLRHAVRKGLASNVAEERAQAEREIAVQIVRDGLGKYEILTSAPLAGGTDLFTKAAFGLGDGNAPMMSDDASG